MSVKLYVEGGGDSKTLKTACRQGFSAFIKKAGLAGKMPSIVACGGREKAYDRFKTAVANKQAALLLVDAEGPVAAAGPWVHLKHRDKWGRPGSVSDDKCHLMVQIMESWFLADPDTLETFFSQGFRKAALPQNPKIEDIPKQDVERGLGQASRNSRKGEYDKGKHSFEILAELNPTKVRNRSPYADRFLRALEQKSKQ